MLKTRESVSYVDNLLSSIEVDPSSIGTPKISIYTSSELSEQQSSVQLKGVASGAIVAIIDKCLDKIMTIISVLAEDVEPSFTELEFYRAPEVRFKDVKEKEDFQLSQHTDFKKCTKFCSLIFETLKTTVIELITEGTVHGISRVLKQFAQEEEDAEILLSECAENKKHLKDLKNSLLNARRNNKASLIKKLNELHEIKEACEEHIGYSLVEWKYLNSYEDNRCYLNELLIKGAEQRIKSEIEDHLVKIGQENRINTEIEVYLEAYTTEKEEETKQWIVQYEADVERLDQEISQAKEQNYKLEREHTNLEREYRQRCRDIEEWLLLRELIRKRQEEEALQNAAATRIQAWWRGVMVRKKLGPYSKKRRRKKPKKKNKKDAKKKKKK